MTSDVAVAKEGYVGTGVLETLMTVSATIPGISASDTRFLSLAPSPFPRPDETHPVISTGIPTSGSMLPILRKVPVRFEIAAPLLCT